MNSQPGNVHSEDAPPHLAELGLIGEPFAGTAAGHFYFAGDDGAQRLDLMLHLAPYSPLLVIAGKPGVGKTTLLRQFMARASPNWRMAAVAARVDMGRDELLRNLIRGFGLLLDHRANYQELYGALVAQLKALRQDAQIPILLLDDAQYLSAAMMELLLKLGEENDAGHILSTILFGTPQLQNLLESPANQALAARIAHTFEVTPFTEQETASYIRYRLRAAGAVDDGPFDAQAMSRIHAASGGIPARINELAWRVLMDKSMDGKERKASGDGSARIWLAPGSHRRRALILAAAVVAVVLIVAGPLRSVFFKQAPLAPAPSNPTPEMQLPPPLAAGEAERVIRPEDMEAIPPAAPETATPPMEKTQPFPLPPPTAEAPPKAQPAPVPAAEPEKTPAQPDAVNPPPAKAPVAHPANGGFLGAEWVRAQPGDHYTLQLMALKEEKTARQFIAMNRLKEKAAYFPVRRDGQTLYAVVYGNYPSQNEAAQAAKKLPAKWGTPNPWVRRFKNLHDEPGL